MRGKDQFLSVNFHNFRITPAYAGKRVSEPCRRMSPEDHPRLCGEKTSWKVDSINTKGSPPPMRGKGCLNRVEECRQRITPAYAGKRPAGRSTASTPKDHPRLCGEKVRMYAAVSANLGSPPPMRGKVLNWRKRKLKRRITPAYAGKSLKNGSSSR